MREIFLILFCFGFLECFWGPGFQRVLFRMRCVDAFALITVVNYDIWDYFAVAHAYRDSLYRIFYWFSIKFYR